MKKTIGKNINFIGAAIHQGQKIKGVENAPHMIKQSGLFKSLSKKYGAEVADFGIISQENDPTEVDKNIEQSVRTQQENHHIKNLPLLDHLLQKVNDRVLESLQKFPNNIVVTVGGDHSVGTGSIHALNQHYQNLKVIWVDAHPDFIYSSMSDYYGYHGYPAAHLTGKTVLPGFKWIKKNLPLTNLVYIGIRDIDEDQWITLKQNNIKCFTIDHIDQIGIGNVVSQAIQYLDPTGNAPFHISFDIDAIDPYIAKGTGTRFRDGLTHREAVHIIRKVSHIRNLIGLDVVQINPELENEKKNRPIFRGQQDCSQVSETVGLGLDLIESIFTKYLTL